jgi:hypothetical protein
MPEIVTRIDDDRKLAWFQNLRQSMRQFRAANSTHQTNDF